MAFHNPKMEAHLLDFSVYSQDNLKMNLIAIQ